MTLQQAKYLLAIMQHGSVTKAAKELYVAQSSLSATIKEVEKEYNLKIFRRNSKGVEPTPSGREFLEDVQHMQDQYEYINGKYNGPPVEGVQLCVSSQHHICGEGAFLRLIAQYESEQYRLGYLEGSTEQLLDDVESGVSDLGLLFYYVSVKPILIQDMRKRDIVFNHIAYRKPHIYVYKGHPLAGRESISQNELKNYPSISYDASGSGASLYTATLRRANPRPQTYLVTERATAYTVMRHTEAYAVGTGYHSEDEAYSDIISIPIEGDEELEVGWIVKGKRHLSEAAEKMIELIKQLYVQ